MGAYNRHIRGETEDVLGKIHGNVEVEAGDFMFRDAVALGAGEGGVRGVGIDADYYVYPFNKATNTASLATGVYGSMILTFLGIAMESSPSGVTESITVATNGVFSYPMVHTSAVTIGALISTVSGTLSAVGVSSQAVANLGDSQATTAYLGYTVKTQSATSYVDFQIRTAYNTGLAV